ncbi:orotate phosphoribosyltransferase [Tichowtungia aerotolerans]|uniref:Orotate phosphoribosyltransferase n=1 Tax=Tichowtungia aerotolerans TaxID=2697043 RepID=A0A6P1MB32_9BACT|nr:orotate phosphoribosyltransferase [Tichowtungia aerotolerans]QHI70313.1 orotate phosphoribosyltransferase [Tichowtungia aerotolerans]
MNDTNLLKHFEETSALLNGHFELRSGLHSNQFFQCALLLQYPRIAGEVCAALVDKVKEELGPLEIDTVIAPALGGISVGHEVGRALGVRFIFAEKNADGALMMRRFKIEKGERFLVAEDVITRGGRVQETVNIVKEHGGVVQAVGVLVDRSGGKAQFDAPLVSLLRMEPVTWDPAECPLCQEGQPLVHPGS